MPYHTLASSLPFLSILFSSILHFLSYSYIPSLLLYFSFLLFSSLVFPYSLLASRYSCCSSLYIAKAFLYSLPWRVLLFYPSITFGLVCMSFLDGTSLSVAQPSSLPYVGSTTFYFQTKEFCFVFLLFVASPSE